MSELPEGTLTFLLTDLEASTRTWETQTGAMREAMRVHDAIVYGAVERSGGASVESGREGDSILAVFREPTNAAVCAVEIQRGFAQAVWPGGLRLRTRIALHTGEVELRGGHYFGPPLNRCARVLALAHGGQILVTQATRTLLAEETPRDVELTDLGLHELKDLRQAERVYQLTDLTRPERFPPLRARAAYKTNLPLQLTSFIGRDRELAELRARLEHTRLLTLTGPGGSGKTRLAKQLLRDVVAGMAGGAWFVDLAPVNDPTLVARTLLTALDLGEQSRPIIETLTDHLDSGPTLVVLDNCEHLLDACATLVETLLHACPDLRIAVTSREPLNVGAETVWRLPPLATAEAERLFVERARARSPHFEPTDGDRAAIAAICRRLDGIPLAIELAAARTALMRPDEILRRLERGLALLAGGDRTVAQRQRTLEATIDWSHALLSEGERALFRRLSVFAGSFSLDAVERVCAGEDIAREAALDTLAGLVAKSLAEPQDGRFRLLETIRTYAVAKLEASAESDALRAGHARYYLALAESRRPGRYAEWMEQVAQDHDNVRAAFAWSLRADVDVAARIAGALYEFWLGRGHALEARAFLGQLAERVAPESPRRSRVMLDAGVFAYTAGDFAAAPALIADGLAVARRVGDRELVARGLIFEGNVALAAGRLEAAQAALDEALATARAIGQSRLEADALHHLGSLANGRGDPSLARARFTESLEVRRRLGTLDEAGTTLTLRSCMGILLHDLAGAAADVREAVGIQLALRDRRAAWSLEVLACLAALDGDDEHAMRLAGSAHSVFESTAQRPPAVWRSFVDTLLLPARQRLGTDRSVAAFDAGRSLSFDQALNEALEPALARTGA